jgi:hypothetical protein
MSNGEEPKTTCKNNNIGGLEDTQENGLLPLVHYT